MSEETGHDDNDIIEEGVVEDWEPVDQRDRTEASPVRKVLAELLVRALLLKEIFQFFRYKQDAGDPSEIPLPPKPKPPTEPPATEPPTK